MGGPIYNGGMARTYEYSISFTHEEHYFEWYFDQYADFSAAIRTQVQSADFPLPIGAIKPLLLAARSLTQK